MMVSAKHQQTLTVFIAFADAKMTEAVGPRALTVGHSGIEIAKWNQRFVLRDVFDNLTGPHHLTTGASYQRSYHKSIPQC